MTKYAVTGATGRFGQAAIKTLLQNVSAADIVALARDTDKAAQMLPDGIAIRSGAYEDAPHLSDSLQGVDRLLMISSIPGAKMSRPEQHQNIIDAAKDAGVRFIAYTSFPNAAQTQAPLAQDHKATEEALRQSGIEFSFLRNNWYLENELSIMVPAAKGEPFVYSAGNGRAGWALEADYAEAAARVLLADESKPIYEFAGAPHTFVDLAEAVKTVTGQSFDVVSLNDEDFAKRLRAAGVDAQNAIIASSLQQLIREGNLDEETTDLPDVLGRPLISLDEAVRQVLSR